MEYQNSDFNADKVKQYEAIREAMARIYEEEPTFFGPPVITPLPAPDQVDENEMADIQRRQKNDKELIKKGYNRIQEKLKEIRQNFANAVTTGSRSGSGKIVLEFFDQLKQIWGGSPSTEPLSCGVSTDDFNDENENDTDPEIQCGSNSAADIGDHTRSGASQADGDKGFSEGDMVASGKKGSKGKKRIAPNPVPKLIDNKRKHLERQLSASQRDRLLMNESKEDSQFKKDIAEAIRQSNETFAQSMQQMSMSMQQVAQGFTQSFQFLARAMFTDNPGQPPYQYPPYQAPADVSDQVRMHGPVHPTGYTQLNTSHQAQPYRYESSQPNWDGQQ
ncbi:hypothetical protein OS493_006728 [Desmophyllum pertusum]|uniref:Uncharacterized protein n=1 Tax=Desmophyllum pertusum TaxID=174260 RepID=A0A9W9ZRX8_9CNID|nr:hypothetical protein OS493_006728 [Desmophyllum pertusum]